MLRPGGGEGVDPPVLGGCGVAVVAVGGGVKSDAGVPVVVVVVVDKLDMKVRAAPRKWNRSGKIGAYFNVLNHASLKGLSLETLGREWDWVICRSASRAETSLLVIEVPRSACTT